MIDKKLAETIKITDTEETKINGELVGAMQLEASDGGGPGRTFVRFNVVGVESGKCHITEAEFEFMDKELEGAVGPEGTIEFALDCRDDSVFLKDRNGKEHQAINPR